MEHSKPIFLVAGFRAEPADSGRSRVLHPGASESNVVNAYPILLTLAQISGSIFGFSVSCRALALPLHIGRIQRPRPLPLDPRRPFRPPPAPASSLEDSAAAGLLSDRCRESVESCLLLAPRARPRESPARQGCGAVRLSGRES